MSNNTLELADSVESDLIKQVLSLEQKSKEALTESEAKIDRTALRSKDVLQVMESAAENVAKLNENIRKLFPEVRRSQPWHRSRPLHRSCTGAPRRLAFRSAKSSPRARSPGVRSTSARRQA